MLTIPLDDGKFRIEADSSDYANGVVLSQFIGGKWRPIEFFSCSLNEVERNYKIYDKEMMAIMDSLMEWHQYLMGSKEPFEIWTDHQNLQYFRKPQKLNCRQAQWVTELAKYSFSLVHKPGKSMGKADALSRMTGLETGVNDNKDIILLKPEFFIRQLHDNPESEIVEWIKKSKNVDKTVIEALNSKTKDWVNEVDGIITWKNRMYVPIDRKLWTEIIKRHHDVITAGHPGQYKTWELVTRTYWWPSIGNDIKRYVKGCLKCQSTKVHRNKPVGTLNPHDISREPWEHIGVDLIGELPEAGGYNAITIFIDHFTKNL